MLISEKTNKITSAAFIAAEAVLTVAIQLTGGTLNSLLSFGAVLLACGYFVLCFERSLSYLLTQTALVFTVLADLFLVVLDPPVRLPAMLFFTVVQICYCIRIIFENKTPRVDNIHIIVRSVLTTLSIALTFIVLGDGADPLAVVSVIYFVNLLLNAAFSFVRFKDAPLLPIGLCLFVLCDVFVGLSMLDAYLPVTEGSFIYALAHPGFNAAWLFYVPAQTLLALSLNKMKHQ